MLIKVNEVPGALDKSVFGYLLSKSWPNPHWAGVWQRGLLPAPSLAWRGLTLEQPFAAEGPHPGRQDICLKSSNRDNISESSN